jgi:alkylhydroperoxidase family enzyme
VPRIRPIDEAEITPPIAEIFADAEKGKAPTPTFLKLLARQPDAMAAFYRAWHYIFYDGIVEHPLKELIRMRMSRIRGCGY